MKGRAFFSISFLVVVVLLFPVFFKMRSSLFPSSYRQDVFKEGTSQQIDPFLIAALIFRESHYRADQTSLQGDRGLMQIQPNTILELERVKILAKGRYSAEDLFNPKINIEIGTLYLNYLRHKILNSLSRKKKIEEWYGGDVWPIVLASYNAGPTFVLKNVLDLSDTKIEYESQLKLKRHSTAFYVDDTLRYYRSLVWMNRVYEF